jgi:hypothetical protein
MLHREDGQTKEQHYQLQQQGVQQQCRESLLSELQVQNLKKSQYPRTHSQNPMGNVLEN